MASGNVQEFLGGSWSLASQLMNQGLAAIALSGEALDVPAEGLTGLMTVVLEVPWVPREFVGALEVSHKDLLQVRPTLNPVGWKVL